MPERDIDPSVHRRRLRNILRRSREDCGVTQSAAAEEMSWSVSKLIRIESGSVTISVNDLRALLRYYGITDGEQVESLVEMARLAHRRSWLMQYRDIASDAYLAYLGAEETAVRSYNFEPVLIPGLLQTDEYAREVLRTLRGPKVPSRTEGLVELRIARQQRVFSRADPPLNLHFLIDESVVRRPVGGAEVMSRQISHLLDLSQRDNVAISVIPYNVGLYRSIRVPFTLLEFNEPEDEALLYLEYPQGEVIIREDVPTLDILTEDAPTTPPTYLEIFSELEQKTSTDQTADILRSALSNLKNPSSRHFIEGHSDDTSLAPVAASEISVAVYLDSDDEEKARHVLERVDQLVREMGYGDPTDIQLERGSLFRRSKAEALQILHSEELRSRLAKVERGLELAGLELRQAQVDHGEAQAISILLAEIKDIPRACIRAGSVMLVKYTTHDGPVLLVRTLSQLEIHALDQYPEIQKNPECLLESLATAIENSSSGEDESA
jgi:transcriptional regulator with XRE-family HTH domain